MAEWNLFHLDVPRPEHRDLSRLELEQGVADQISQLLSNYGTIQRQVKVAVDDGPDDPWTEFFTIVDVEHVLDDGSELYIGQLPVINGVTFGRKGLHSLSLIGYGGTAALDLAIQDSTFESDLTIVNSADQLPPEDQLDELNDALHIIRTGYDASRPRNQFPIDPSRYPRQQKPFRTDFCRSHS